MSSSLPRIGTISPDEKSLQRAFTEPLHDDDIPRIRIKKRVIVCCDGTWQDGVSANECSKYTNILRLARTINSEDRRFNPPIPQIVFYQSGIGSEKNFYSEYIEGATGSSLAEKVEEAYAFIAHNFQPGDEIFLFGFSRGAYTARMVAMLIGEIGVLNRTDMGSFGGIFFAYQKLGNSKDKTEIEALREQLAPWNQRGSPGKIRADSDQATFSIKCVGVFDTVGSLGLPEELTFHSKQIRTLFGFHDKALGEHIERAYHALALNETRADFDCCKFEQTEGGRRKKQVLKQCWFTGCHSDIGGGYQDHDLADLTLTWMAAHVEDILALDLNYLASLPQPVAPWGEQKPHDPATGFFSLARENQRQLPTSANDVTNEVIHPSVLQQVALYPILKDDLTQHPELVCTLKPLEEEMKVNWPFKAQVGPKATVEVTKQTVRTSIEQTQVMLKVVTQKETGVTTKVEPPMYKQTQVTEVVGKVPSQTLATEKRAI